MSLRDTVEAISGVQYLTKLSILAWLMPGVVAQEEQSFLYEAVSIGGKVISLVVAILIWYFISRRNPLETKSPHKKEPAVLKESNTQNISFWEQKCRTGETNWDILREAWKWSALKIRAERERADQEEWSEQVIIKMYTSY